MGRALRAREPQAAAHSTRLILLVCSVVVAGLTVFQQSGAGTFVLTVHWLGVAVLLAGALACWVLSPEALDRLGISLLAAVFGVVLICTLNLLPTTRRPRRRRSSPSRSSGPPPTSGRRGWCW